MIGTPYKKRKLDGPLVVLNIKRVKFCNKVLKQIYGFDEHVKNAAVTDVTEQGEHERPAAALWMYNYIGTTILLSLILTNILLCYSWLEGSV